MTNNTVFEAILFTVRSFHLRFNYSYYPENFVFRFFEKSFFPKSPDEASIPYRSKFILYFYLFVFVLLTILN
jgi:hypothetical protein